MPETRLQNLRNALKPHSRVDVLPFERLQAAVGKAVGLHEHQVVKLDEPAQAGMCSQTIAEQALGIPNPLWQTHTLLCASNAPPLILKGEYELSCSVLNRAFSCGVTTLSKTLTRYYRTLLTLWE